MSDIGGCTSCAGPQGKLQELLSSYRPKNATESGQAGAVGATQDPSQPQGPNAVAGAGESDTRQAANPGDIQSAFRQLGEGARGALIGAQSAGHDGPRLSALDTALDSNGDGTVSFKERLAGSADASPAGQASAPDDSAQKRLLTEAIVDHQRAAQIYGTGSASGTLFTGRGLGVTA